MAHSCDFCHLSLDITPQNVSVSNIRKFQASSSHFPNIEITERLRINEGIDERKRN